MAERAAPTPGHPADAAVREQALDPRRSFIVQAPAGSGKTELLTQRLLVLLAQAEAPEQVLAITFTRKAAAEMRGRLLDALQDAADATPAETPLAAATRARAQAVLARDAERGWALLDSPGRLRIQTIDALCAALARARPLGSGLGEAPRMAEEAEPLYREAARSTLAALEAEGPEREPVQRLLLHLDGNQARSEELLAGMLARRDQWLRHLSPDLSPAALRAGLQAELRAAVDEALRAAHEALAAAEAGASVATELAALLPHAARHAAAADPASPIAALEGLAGLPAPHCDALPHWRGLAELLTTAKGEWRRRLTRNEGFPTDKASGDPAALKAAKARAQALLDALGSTPAGIAAATRLRDAARLPEPVYGDAQWAVLEALLTLLPAAVAALRQAFAAAGECDFAEVALAAVRALGSADDNDTGPLHDEARHLLVDEFQDTSHGQFRLLEALTAHWPADGSHTLFLVGDPMQSIYRFREAEVGLFLRAQRQGLGPLRPTPLRLTVNFRSTPALVGWVNAVFPHVLAAEADATAGAVPFAPAEAFGGGGAHGDAPAVHVHPLLETAARPRPRVDAEEGERVAALIAAERAARPEASIAVLVRTRGHLRAVLPALQRAGLSAQALEIEALAQRPEVQDVLMLARALTHPGDRVAWLALLRAPWCGLALADLLALAGDAPRTALWTRITDAAVAATLSADGRARLERLAAALAPALAQRGRRSLRRWVESAWCALGGPAVVPVGLPPNVESCLARLEALPGGADGVTAQALERLLERLYAAPDPAADARLQVMSMHRAKGLEFDVVILPGLGRVPRPDEPPLLRWFERPTDGPGAAAGRGLLLAPIQQAGGTDPLFGWLARLERDKARHETDRLLYVAVTRARRAVHLLGHAVEQDGAPRAPQSRSLLARLWPTVADDYEALAATAAAAAAGDGPATDAGPAAMPAALRRLVSGWQAPAAPRGVPVPGLAERDPDDPDAPPELPEIEFRWAGDTARHVGTVVHRLLRLLARRADDGARAAPGAPGAPDAGAPMFSTAAIEAALAGLGVDAAERPAARARVQTALAQTLADPRGQWILAPHPDARSEYALSTAEGGGASARVSRHAIDRTFLDEDGTRWIVDFKTGAHEGGDPQAFLAREQERYREQLERYAAVMARLEPGRPIRLALYFPLLGAWREWAAPGS